MFILLILSLINILINSQDDNYYLAQQYYNEALACDINSNFTCSIKYYNEGIYSC